MNGQSGCKSQQLFGNGGSTRCEWDLKIWIYMHKQQLKKKDNRETLKILLPLSQFTCYFVFEYGN
jgi:hypothetical protein